MEPWDLSCPDWERKLLAGESLIPANLPLDRDLVATAQGIFTKLRIPDVPGTPRLADVAGQWILDIVAVLFGSLDRATQVRMVRGLFLLVPKKNAKTTYSAALMLTALLMNKRPAARLLMTGPSQEISDLAFSQAAGMIKLDDEGFLPKRLKVRDHLSQIEDLKTGATLKIKTFDEDIVTGGVITAALLDEIHLLGKRARAAAIIQQLRGGMVSVPESFLAMITTQSFEPPAGVFKSELQVARAIRDGKARVDTLPVLYEFPERLQKDAGFWSNPKNWHLVTPNVDRSIRIGRLQLDFEEAKLKGPAEVQLFASQHLNVEIGLGLHTDRWAGAEHWERSADQAISFEALLERSEVIVFGIDGGGLDDLLGFSALGRCRTTKKILSWSKAWAHKTALKRRQDIAPRLLDFEADGDLELVSRIDEAYVGAAQLVERALIAGLLDRVCVDRAGVAGIVTALKAVGVPEDLIEGVHQGWQLSGSIKDTEGALSDGRLVHADQPLMDWCVSNAKATSNGNAISITKQHAGTGKIDPLVALFVAMSRMRLEPMPASAGSIYDDETAYTEAFGEAAPAAAQLERWDPAVLADIRHPAFAEHKRRFETWQLQQED